MIRYLPGQNLVDDDAHALVNTVNTDGYMGKGLALDMRKKFPEVMDAYRAACHDGRLQPGGIQVLPLPEGRSLLNVATKQHWRGSSRYEWAGPGLIHLNRCLCEKRPDIRSVAVPPLGCGNGKLDWTRVHRMTRSYLKLAAANGVDIRLHAEEPAAVEDPVFFAGVGSRETPDPVLSVMQETGALLAADGWRLRSGGAIGADTAFWEGARTAGLPMEIFVIENRPEIPGAILGVPEPHRRMVRSVHPAPHRLGQKGMMLMARNGAQVFGLDFTRPSDCVICWTVGGSGKGGTGQAIRLATMVGIPVLDLGRKDLAGITAPEVAVLARDLVAAHRAAIGIPMPARAAQAELHAPAP
ncbi:macro domain-containing protein [Cereibacter sphaeroides]|uniref:macro domain-containing protein n=1 Tax=Cereibacter sphaeroides TaxID=1063 RepID=UPI001F37DA11|nr:macro domain-containing protein [Cereibacter sphaeroides]MCE6958269.1 macro domain-containing protein [Cereibacter sphaeroides]MCE6971332.1 macro domain-containing protein [Cereibacter sphaeroides]